MFLTDTHDLLPATSKGRQSKKQTSKGAQKSSRKAGDKSSVDPDCSLAAIGGRDTSLFLFRALGKILYCKSEHFF
jgi:cell cycle checkpoint protein